MKSESRFSPTMQFVSRSLTLLLCAFAGVAPAATYTWTGAGFFGNQDYLWSNPNNWAGLAAPSPGEANVTIVFPNNAAPKVTTNDLVGLTVAAVQFQGSNYVVHGKPAGNALKLYGSGLGGWAAFASFNGNQFASTCSLVLSNSGIVSVASGCTLSIWAPMSGAGGLTKSSPGTLRYTAFGANTYTGTTSVTDGTLELFNGTSSANTAVAIAGPLSIGGTNVAYAPRVKLLFNEQIGNTVSVSVYHNGELWLNGHDETVGSLTVVDGAEVSTGLNGGFSSPGLLTLNGNVTNSSTLSGPYAIINGRLDLGLFTRTFQVDYYMQINADISGGSIFNPGLTKTGLGNLILGGQNTYAGPTLAQEGTLSLYYDSTPGNTNAGTTVAADATLDLYSSTVQNESLVLNGDPNTPTVSFSASNHWTGPVTLNGPCRVVDWSSPGDPENDMNFAGAISGTGSLRKSGYGKLFFTGFGGNTFTGGLYCGEGFTYLNKSASAPALSGPLVIGNANANGQYVFCSVMQLNQIPNNVPISLIEYGALSADNNATDTLGPIEISGGLLTGITGTFTLAGDVTNHSSANPASGIYGNIQLSGVRSFYCDDGSTLNVVSPLGGAGGIYKYGGGTLSLSGACTYSQATAIWQGTLKLENQGRPGSGAFGTMVASDGALSLNGVNLTNYSFNLYGGGTNNGHALVYHNTNYLAGGNVDIHNGVIFRADPTARLTIKTTITGDGGLGHVGNGTLELNSFLANSYAGTTTFREGTLLLNHSSGSASIPHSLTVGYGTNGSPAATVKCLGPNQFAQLFGIELGFGGVTLNPGASLDCNGFDQTIANLYMADATVTGGAGVLTLLGNLNVNATNGSASYIFNPLRLGPGVGGPHTFNVASNASLLLWGDLSETGGAQSIYKDGPGSVGTLGNNSFSGTLTVHEGSWLAGGSNPFGTPAGPTSVDAGATLYAYTGTNSEPLALSGSGLPGAGGALICYQGSTNLFNGPITLAADAVIQTQTNSLLTFSGMIVGAGGFTKEGPGTIQLLGANPNAYGGATVVNLGKLELGKTNVVAVPGPLTVTGPNSSSYVRLLRPEQISDTASVVLQNTGWIALEGNNETIGSLAGIGSIYQSAGQSGLLTVGGNGDSTTFSGTILGGGGLTKTGAGTFTLTANNTYTGTTTVSGGKLLVNGQQPSSPVSINTGGTLGGTGRVGNLSDLNGQVAPGASPGILVCSNYSTFSPANLLQIEINGPNPGSGYDQLQVNGAVLLMGGLLQVTMNYPGAVANEYIILSNDGVDPVSGSFTGLPEGAMLTNNGVAFQISYHGGDGNDVSLLQQTTAPTSQITQVEWTAPGSFKFHALGVPNTHYRVEATTNLEPPVLWETIGGTTSDDNGTLQFSDSTAGQLVQRFYRLRLP